MTFQPCFISTYTTAGVDIAYSTCTSLTGYLCQACKHARIFCPHCFKFNCGLGKNKAILVVLYQKMQYKLTVKAITFLER